MLGLFSRLETIINQECDYDNENTLLLMKLNNLCCIQ